MEEIRRSRRSRGMSVRNDLADENGQAISIWRKDSETHSEAHKGKNCGTLGLDVELLKSLSGQLYGGLTSSQDSNAWSGLYWGRLRVCSLTSCRREVVEVRASRPSSMLSPHHVFQHWRHWWRLICRPSLEMPSSIARHADGGRRRKGRYPK
jgi:hypothetical protein